MAIDKRLLEEQAAFNAALDSLLEEHADEYVIFHDKRPVAFFRSHADAYATALEQFGLDTVFLIAKVEPPRPGVVSLAWEAGLVA